jgi:hypothetical protein
VTDYPIIFSAPMVRALLDGRKTQTRRLAWRLTTHRGRYCEAPTIWQKVKPGDRLYVRERFSYDRLDIDRNGMAPPWYWADGNPERGDWTKPKPSIHMPRWASRLTLGVTEKRQDPLLDISEKDAQAESFQPEDIGDSFASAAGVFQIYWSEIHPDWDGVSSPEVVALTFTVHQLNIDSMEAAA